MIWRERKIPLIVMAVLLLGNLFFFFTYRVQYHSRLTEQDARLDQAQRQLAEAQRARISAEQQLASYAKVRQDLEVLYNDRWSTQAKRFTQLFLEVKKLVAASHFDPRTFSFTRTETQSNRNEPGSEGNTTVGMSFTVQGTYEQVRQLINLLELSNQFVIIDSIGLNAAGNDSKNLTLSIHLKTMFREPAPTANAQRANRQL
jgi:chaperonin cofactor prefoldin